ncbi:MAG: AAA family ATPase [Flavobacteriales bacterium]|nr:AAA family ATPase [Flavobacteriales bacterium]
MEKNTSQILDQLEKVKKSGNGYIACCPAHNDKNPSLSVTFNGSGVLLHCHAGCDYKDIINSLNMSSPKFATNPNINYVSTTNSRQIKEIYDYRDANGSLQFQIIRYANKSFSIRQRDKSYSNSWINNGQGLTLIPYNLPKINKAIKNNEAIYIVEGEKDVNTLAEKFNLTGTCNPFGAGKWKDTYSNHFKSANIVIIPDNDKSGVSHAKEIIKKCDGIVSSIKLLELPDLDDKEDISDWINKGGTKDQLLELVENLSPLKPKKNKVELRSFEDLAKEGANLPVLGKLLGDFILENCIVLFPSERGIGKSFYIMETCIVVASNSNEFCGEEINLHGNSLYINFEMGENVLKRRLNKLYKNLPDGVTFSQYRPYCLTYNGNLASNMDDIRAHIKSKNPVIVAIDNLRTAFSGKDNEKNSEMTQAIKELIDLKNEMNFAMVLVHHTKKGTTGKKTDSDLQSGAGAISDLIDGDFFLRKSSQDLRYRILKRIKNRECEDQDGAKLIYFNPDTLWFEHLEDNVNEEEHINSDYQGDIQENINKAKRLFKEYQNKSKVAKEMGVDRSTVGRWLEKGN